VVLTDAQAFDGAIITRLAASGRLEKIRRAPNQPVPIDLRIRHPDPERALWLMYHREDGSPRQFLSSLFPDGQGRSVTGTDIAPRSTASADGLKACVQTLTRAGAPPADIDQAVDGWRALLDACRSQTLPTSTWQTETPFQDWVVRSERLWTRERLRADHCLTPSATELLDEVIALEQDRSSVHRLLDQAHDLTADEDMLRAVGWTRLWFDERYRRALAFQHRADYRGSDSGLFEDDAQYRSAMAQLSDAGPEMRQIKVALPAGFVKFLGDVETHSWQHMVGLHSDNLHKWWYEGDTDAIRRVLDSLSVEADKVQGRPESTHSFIKSFGTNLFVDIVSLPLIFDRTGIGIVLVLQLLTSAVEAAGSNSPTRPQVEVTDYFDDARL